MLWYCCQKILQFLNIQILPMNTLKLRKSLFEFSWEEWQSLSKGELSISSHAIEQVPSWIFIENDGRLKGNIQNIQDFSESFGVAFESSTGEYIVEYIEVKVGRRDGVYEVTLNGINPLRTYR